MNSLGSTIVWSAMQTTAFGMLAAAVCLVARRRGPAVSAFVISTSLLLMASIAMLAFCPWPHWRGFAETSYSVPSPQSELADSSEPTEASQPATAAAPATPTLESRRAPRPASEDTNPQPYWLTAAFWNDVASSLRESPAPGETAWTWQSWIAIAFFLGVAIHVVRLAYGVLAVRSYRRRSRPIADADLLALFENLRGTIGCSQPVQLCECDLIGSPATLGWRRPMVLLPTDWRDLNRGELRAVLAHELAHVARGDYVRWLLARCCVAVQFYHPLAYWLARRLRLEQELTADARGAAAAGGCEAYLASLARSALRADDRRLAWGARPFLPERGTLLRRIEMLRTNRPGSDAVARPVMKTWSAGLLIATAMLFAGLRGPANEAPASAAEEPAKGEASEPIDLTYVPNDAMLVAAIRPSALAANPALAEQFAAFDAEFAGQHGGLRLGNLKYVKVAVVSLEMGARGPRQPRVIIKALQPVDWKAFMLARAPEFSIKAQNKGVTYYRNTDGPDDASRAAWFSPDPTTLVLSAEVDLKRAIEEGPGPGPGQPAWLERWNEASQSTAAVAVDGVKLRTALTKLAAGLPARTPAAAFQQQALLFFEGLEFLTAELNVTDKVAFAAWASCSTPDAARNLKGIADALLIAAKQALPTIKTSGNESDRAFASIADAALQTVVLEAKEKTITLQAESPAGVADLVRIMVHGTQQGREAARRSQSANNLRQIGSALHQYEEAHKHFPPAILKGPNGTPYSWRVELLPYLNAQALYDEYRRDEPWDSENNRRVLAKMPAVYRNPGADPTSTVTAYLAITGADTCFPLDKGATFAEILDGASNTILVVETKSDIPWTKPEDLLYDPAKDPPKGGGLFPEGFQALLGDNAVRIFSSKLNPKQLRAFMTKAGRDGLQ